MVVALFQAAPAAAISPFTRRYHLGCGTCHAGGPSRLSPFGDAFRDNGYLLPADEAFARDPPMALGAPARAMLFPNTIWPGELPATAPLGAQATFGLAMQKEREGGRTATETEAQIDLVAAGRAGRHFLLLAMIEIARGEVEIEKLALVFSSLAQATLGEGRLNLLAGIAWPDVAAVPRAQRRAIHAPLALEVGVGRDGFSLSAPAAVVQAFGLLPHRVRWVLGAARAPQDEPGVDGAGGFARLAAKWGFDPFSAGDADALLARAETSSVLVELGIAGYLGRMEVTPAAPEPSFSSDLQRALADVRLRAGGLDLHVLAVAGRDTLPLGTGIEVRHLALAAEIEHAVWPWLIPHLRAEGVSFDDARTERRRLVAGVAIFVRTNVRIRLEGVAGLVRDEPRGAGLDVFMSL